jgi:transcriptional regulator with XRE-family HTH domain
MTDREAFGLELRHARERRGLTLEEVCERTKVGIAHFSGLERGDISRWPAGIFRRAFIRSYALAVGLDAEALVVRFGRVFPDPGDGQRPALKTPRAAKEPDRPPREADPAVVDEAPPAEPAEALTLRLVLDLSASVESPSRAGIVSQRVLTAAIDLLLPLAAAGLVAVIFGRGWFWFTAATMALIGLVGVRGLTGWTPGGWLVRLSSGQTPIARSGTPARRRSDLDLAPAGRRHVSRLPASRPGGHAHRVRH